VAFQLVLALCACDADVCIDAIGLLHHLLAIFYYQGM
jgi:hypothetical protein